MPTLKGIYDFLDKNYPFSLQEDFDNSGIMCGDLTAPVNKILLSLDVTGDVINEAEDLGADLIISHHPVIFEGIKSLVYQDVNSWCAFMLSKKGIACISAHTNLDAATGGVNDALASALHLKDVKGFALSPGGADFGRIGNTDIGSPEEFALFVKECLGCDTVGLTKGSQKVKVVAVLGGSGSGYLEAALSAGADTYVTGECKHNVLLNAKEYGVNIITAGHYYTENPVMALVKDRLETEYPDLQIVMTRVHHSPVVAL